MENLEERNEGGKCTSGQMCMRVVETSEKKIGMSAIERKLMFPIKQREQKKKEKEKIQIHTVEMFT